MVINGTFQYKTTSGGGIDGNGDPIQSVDSWSEPIDCLINPNSTGKLMKYKDGEYVAASYSINIEIENIECSAIRLTNNRGLLLGEFQVLPQNIYKYSFVNRLKITV